MQRPLAVEPEGGGASGDAAQAVEILDGQVRAVDHLQVVGAGGHQQRHQDVVIGITGVVAVGLLAHDQRLHLDRRHEVGRTEDQRLVARAGRGDLVDRQQAARVLDLDLETDATHLKTLGLFDLGDEHIQCLHLRHRLCLRQHQAVEVRPGAAHDVDDVAVGPLGGPVVDAHHAGGVAETALV